MERRSVGEFYLDVVFFAVFAALICISIAVCYKNLLVERHYAIFETEEEAEAASTAVFGALSAFLGYGTTN